jgi:hypothetical protein
MDKARFECYLLNYPEEGMRTPVQTQSTLKNFNVVFVNNTSVYVYMCTYVQYVYVYIERFILCVGIIRKLHMSSHNFKKLRKFSLVHLS